MIPEGGREVREEHFSSGHHSRVSRREEERLGKVALLTPALKAIHLKEVIKLLDQI